MEKQTYLTVLNSEEYLQGVLTLYHSVKKNCNKPFVVMVSDDMPDNLTKELEDSGIDYFVHKDDGLSNAEIFNRLSSNKTQSHWAKTFFKLQVFGLTQYEKIVYLDSDMLVVDCLDELFEKPHMAAVSDDDFVAGREEGIMGFNSGTMVIKPEDGLVAQLVEMIPRVAVIKKHFGDQDVLNLFFYNWINQPELHLPVNYNACAYRMSDYKNELKVKVLHYVGKNKPWMWSRQYRFIRQASYILRRRIKNYRAVLMYIKEIGESKKSGR